MTIHWGMFWTRTRKPLKTFWLITAAIVAVYLGLIQPQQERSYGIASSRATGLAYSAGTLQPLSLWRQAGILGTPPAPMLQKGASVDRASLIAYDRGDADKSEQFSPNRKLVRTAIIEMTVKSPAQCTEKIVQLAQKAGGFLVSSQVSGVADSQYASLSIRVPAGKFEEVGTQIRTLGLRVDQSTLDSTDVTKQYVDDDARLRNLSAQEQQYLAILRRATTVKDTLEVSDKLNEVRGTIEEKEAEFAALSKQVDTVAINITLRAEADAQVFGLHWRPLYQLKIAAREGLEGIGMYIASMTFFILYLPTIALWLFTILVGAAMAWRILRWTARVFFLPADVGAREQTPAQ